MFSRGRRDDSGDELTLLALIMMVAWSPWFSTGDVLRWVVLSAGLGLASEVRIDAFPPWFLVALAVGFGWMALSLFWSPDPWGGAGEIIGFVLLSGTMIAASGA